MTRMAFIAGLALAGGLGASGAVHLTAAQQQKAPPSGKPAAVAPGKGAAWPIKLKDGQPDMQGFWEPVFGPGAVGTYIEPQRPDRSDGVVIDPPDGQIPYLPWARVRRDEVKDHWLSPNPAQLDT